MSCALNFSVLGWQGPNLIINQPDKLLDGMSDWCKEHHGKVSCLLLWGALKKDIENNIEQNIIFAQLSIKSTILHFRPHICQWYWTKAPFIHALHNMEFDFSNFQIWISMEKKVVYPDDCPYSIKFRIQYSIKFLKNKLVILQGCFSLCVEQAVSTAQQFTAICESVCQSKLDVIKSKARSMSCNDCTLRRAASATCTPQSAKQLCPKCVI